MDLEQFACQLASIHNALTIEERADLPLLTSRGTRAPVQVKKQQNSGCKETPGGRFGDCGYIERYARKTKGGADVAVAGADQREVEIAQLRSEGHIDQEIEFAWTAELLVE